MTAKGAFDEKSKRDASADDATMDNVLHATDNNENFPAANASQHRLKRSGMDFYTMTLGSPKYVVSASLRLIVVDVIPFLRHIFFH